MKDRDPEDCADSMRSLIEAVNHLNAAAATAREAMGLSVQLYVNGYEFGDRVGVRIEGDLAGAYDEPPAKPSKAEG